MHISYLPNDVLGEIAKFSQAIAIGNLWCCGCRLLNSKLMSPDGMRVYDLLDGFMPVRCVPRFIYSLEGLQHIDLNFRSSEPANSTHALPYDFFSYAYGKMEVKTISVRSEELLEGWFVPRSDKRSIEVKNRFHLLHTLELSASKSIGDFQQIQLFLLSLPRTLTSLSIIGPRPWQKTLSQSLTMPSNIQELTLGLEVTDLDFVFSLPLLRKLALPHVTDEGFSVKASKPLLHLERLELKQLRHLKSPRHETRSREQHSLLEFMSLLPNINQLVSNENSFKWKSNPNWFKIRHFYFVDLFFLPVSKLPAHVETIEARAHRFDEGGHFEHFHHLTSLHLHMCIRLHDLVLPESVTSLGYGWLDEFENELAFLPTNLVHLTRLCSESLGSIPIGILPDTLSSVVGPADLCLNAKKVIKNWNGSTWISIGLALDTDDSYLFDTIWNYFKPTSQQLILNVALKAACRNRHATLETILSKDIFWNAFRSATEVCRSDFLLWAPVTILPKLFREGLRFGYFPISKVKKMCKLNSVEFLELVFSDLALRTPANTRFSFTAAIFAKSHTCARWLIDHDLYECDLQEITRKSITARDMDFLNMLLELNLNLQVDPRGRILRLPQNHIPPKILPIDASGLCNLNIEYSIRFLDWATSFGVVGAFVDDETVNLILECYRTLPQELSHTAEPIFLATFSWLRTHRVSFASHDPQISCVAEKLGHTKILDLLSPCYYSCVLQ